MVVIFLISFVLLIIYIGKISSIYTSWDEVREWRPTTYDLEDTGLSIIIPMRNEVQNIKACLASILHAADRSQLNKIEVLCIDDQSEDTSFEIAQGIKDPRLIVVRSKTQGKKGAIQTAIDLASYDHILCTDADCIVHQDWIRQTLSFLLKSKAQMITGLVAISPTERFIDKWQYLDVMGMMAVTAFGIQRDSFRIGNGANMAFRKSAFLDLNAYSENTHLASGDDVFLIQAAYRKWPDQVRFFKSQGGMVYTKGEASWNTLWEQRKRWATKTRSYQEKGVIHLQGFIWFYHIIILVSLLSYPFFGGISFFTGLLMLFVKFCMDYLLLSKLADYFDNRDPLKWYIPIGIIHFFYLIYAGLMALIPQKYQWKNRRVS